MRVPARFVQLAGLGGTLLAARGLDALLFGQRRRAVRAGLVAVVICLLAVELLPASARWDRLGDEADFPAVDHWLAKRSEVSAYLDLPLPPANRLAREYLAMYLSTLHWKPLVNGRSGHVPATWERVYQAIRVMPDAQGVALLRSLGVTHIVVRASAMHQGRRRRESYLEWTRRFDRDGQEGLELIYQDATEDRVYRIAPGG